MKSGRFRPTGVPQKGNPRQSDQPVLALSPARGRFSLGRSGKSRRESPPALAHEQRRRSNRRAAEKALRARGALRNAPNLVRKAPGNSRRPESTPSEQA